MIGASSGPKSCICTRIERRTSTNPGFEKNSGLQGPFARDHWIGMRCARTHPRHKHAQQVSFPNRILMELKRRGAHVEF